MREVVLESRACDACGAFVYEAREGGAVLVRRSGGTCFRASLASLLTAAPRERSGLAYAAGYAGLLSLFRYSFISLTLILGLLAPLALGLSFAAAVSLDRAPWKSGRLPALVAFALGWQGSYTLLFLLDEIWRWLPPHG